MTIRKANKAILFGSAGKSLRIAGENIKLARKRRDWTQEQLAQRANTSRKTVERIEAGDSSVGMGYYVSVLDVLSMLEHVEQIGLDDPFGRKLDDIKLLAKRRV